MSAYVGHLRKILLFAASVQNSNKTFKKYFKNYFIFIFFIKCTKPYHYKKNCKINSFY